MCVCVCTKQTKQNCLKRMNGSFKPTQIARTQFKLSSLSIHYFFHNNPLPQKKIHFFTDFVLGFIGSLSHCVRCLLYTKRLAIMLNHGMVGSLTLPDQWVGCPFRDYQFITTLTRAQNISAGSKKHFLAC